MITGRGTGKGLDIKGKSARRGVLAGFVPFVQIHHEEHKRKFSAVAKVRKSTMRAYYGSEGGREQVWKRLESHLCDLADSGEGDVILRRLDELGPSAGRWGIECSLVAFWYVCVASWPLEREEGSDLDTGRPSEPAFQDMNLEVVRREENDNGRNNNKEDGDGVGGEHKDGDAATTGGRRCVVWQSSEADPLDSRTLLMAYEENGRVLPVVSDFDCFIVGSRGLKYADALPLDQVELMRWCVSQARVILDSLEREDLESPETHEVPWTGRWLDVLKRAAMENESYFGKKNAYTTPTPPLGFGDPVSYSVIEHATSRTESFGGAVRHGPECFNYKFPQELDNEFLVVSDILPSPVPWIYVTEPELRELLCPKIGKGFTFPLNPKWIVCDPGWRNVYDRLLSSP
mmetsp:Transcript_30249/g.90059  ORF Transcript_30249/g.90059 Transcript_30249/m.90059 type:complete len:402 (+) Transcript_30249:1401-2606(+)